MFIYVYFNIKRAHPFTFPQAIKHFSFAFNVCLVFQIIIYNINKITPSLLNDYSIRIDISLVAFVCLILAKADAKLLKQQLFNNFWQYLSIMHYYETWFFLHILNFRLDLQTFQCILILCFVMPLKYFPIEIRFMCDKMFLNPIKVKSKPLLCSWRLTLELELSFILFLFVSVVFKYFQRSMTTCAYILVP